MQTLLSVLRVPAEAVFSAYRVGSRVYGTARPDADEDFVAVLAKPGQKQDLAFGPLVNVVIHGLETFQQALNDQSVFALECYFAPKAHVLKAPKRAFQYKLDKKKLALSALHRSQADWDKGMKRFMDEPGASKKKLFHALRVAVFAREVLRTGKISDFQAANGYWREIDSGPDDAPDFYEERLGAARAALIAELQGFAGKRG